MQSPVKTTKTLLAFIVFAVIFLDYWSYSALYYREPGVYLDVLHGTAPAPNQYRVGVIRAASFIAQHGHMGLRHGVTLLDGLSTTIAVYVLYALLGRSASYIAASNEMRWLGSAVFVVLVQFYLAWLTWYQRPETMPTAALVALALWLLTPRNPVTRSTAPIAAQVAIVVALLSITAAQATIRADAAVALNLGILLVSITPLGKAFSVPRSAMIATSFLGIAIGGGIQIYMMRIAYPQATYGSTPVFQLILNLTDHLRVFPFVIFLLPWAWTLVSLARKRVDVHAPSAALVAAGIAFLAPWCIVGKIDEVRIFLPFALAIVPLTAQAVMRRATSWT